MPRNKSSDTPDAGRRRLLESSAVLLGASVLPIQWSLLARAAETAAQALAAGSPLRFLAAAEAADLEGIAERIIPADDTPGAREAGVIHFMDQALGGFMAPAAGALRAGLAELNSGVAADHEGRRFSELGSADQDAALTEIQDGPFFGLVRFLTIAGFLCLPSQGGNRDGVGWALLGFDHRHAWQPPFGYYDAPVHGGRGDDHD